MVSSTEFCHETDTADRKVVGALHTGWPGEIVLIPDFELKGGAVDRKPLPTAKMGAAPAMGSAIAFRSVSRSSTSL